MAAAGRKQSREQGTGSRAGNREQSREQSREQGQEWGPTPGVTWNASSRAWLVPAHHFPPTSLLSSPCKALRREHEPLTLSHELWAPYGSCDTFLSGTGKPWYCFSCTPELSCRQGPDPAKPHPHRNISELPPVREIKSLS